MTTDNYVVFIVDDDGGTTEAVGELLETCGMRAVAFGSAGEYVTADKSDVPACLILGVELPDINGLELQRQIAKGDHPPIALITGDGDIPSSVCAMKDRKTRSERAELSELRHRYLELAPREREVPPLVVSGLLNKQAASELAISEVTLQIHRRNVMQKIAAVSLADHVLKAARLGIPITHSRRAGGH
ncbi:response regulator transcription factor [Rhizobium mongolense]|uniref:FixJ family two-component response regulator n=1 Tax=Rhizobium mongolense TaxID=57676 RepID=A0A7W6WHV7_9HYPH|nr:LuxR C-terminal-related transcriptional regulator [Rhizobium mongolense]MBB4278435.1 FixJ family two-component response regulator [Rhizobium mongolense]